MPVIIEPPDENEARPPLWTRLAWFIGLALGAALVTAVVAEGLRAVLLWR